MMANAAPRWSRSDNEMAKAHARYLAGGRAPGVTSERLYRFEFPERPGALGHFLQALAEVCVPHSALS